MGLQAQICVTSWRTFRLRFSARLWGSNCANFFSSSTVFEDTSIHKIPKRQHFDTDNMLGAVKLENFDIQDTSLYDVSFENKEKFTVAVEGNIGCGKTTLLEYFNNTSPVETLQEPIKQWTNLRGHNALKSLYEDPGRWSFSFNMYALLSRVRQHNREHTKPVKMLERSLYSTRHCFVENDYRNNVISGMEYSILTKWFDWLVNSNKAELDLIIYLQADPKVCYERIKRRSRKEESLVPYSLIENLHNLHEEWLIENRHLKPPAPVIVLDANRSLNEMEQLYETRRQDILCGCV